MLKYFNEQWNTVPMTVLDVETTGTKPGVDRVVQIGLARFEGGSVVDRNVCEINPGIPIPSAATEIHGITDDMVREAPALDAFMGDARTKRLLEGAQLCGYNSRFDQLFVLPYLDDFQWPWLDALSFVRYCDRFAKGQGRHKLAASCARHGIDLTKAHDAGADAVAAGALLHKLVRDLEKTDFKGPPILGELLRFQRALECDEWWRFCSWLSKQPPREETQP